jgi:hypothetical protein
VDILLSIQNFYDCVQVSKFRNRNIIICWRLVIMASSGFLKKHMIFDDASEIIN